LRDDIGRFQAKSAQVVAVAPGGAEGVRRFVADQPYPFPMLADTEHGVFDAYDVVSRIMSLGQRPAVFVIGSDGVVRFDSIGAQQWQIPSDDVVLSTIP
jgi:peroxiredoxin